jgi:hypothetical protein
MMALVAELGRPSLDVESDATPLRWARTHPEQIALLHKRHGLWHALRWPEIAAHMQEIMSVLAEDGHAVPTRLVVSGDTDTNMIGFILAARALGGLVIPIPRLLRGEKLQMEIDSAQPTHVFLRYRRDVPHWRDIRLRSGSVGQIFLNQISPRRLAAWQLRPIPGARVAATAGRPKLTLRKALKGRGVLWTDEGTNWPDGLLQAIDAWLRLGDVLALPETGESVIRDRIEVQPTELFLSPGRRQALGAEMERRLPKAGSWARALCDRALAEPGNARLGMLRRRILALSGIRRASDARTSQVVLVGARS